MNRLGYAIAVGATVLVAAPSARAQVRTTGRTDGSVMVPAGMCRIWIDGVPANRQPAPTDCSTARATVPPNGRIIYGDQQGGYGSNGQYDPRLDPRSPQYDPRLDPRSRDGKWEAKADRERAKWERKRARQQRKEWEKAQRRRGDDEGDDEDDDDHDEHEGQRGGYGQSGRWDQNTHHDRDDRGDEYRSSGRHGRKKG